MMKSEFFKLLLHQNYANDINMAKKKKAKSEKRDSSFTSIIGIKNIFQNEKLNFVIGIVLIIVAFYFILAFVSYFSTGSADQSLIEDPREGEMLNEHHEFSNTCGSVGAYVAWYFIKRCFGLPAFLIPVFIMLLGIHMVKAYRGLNVCQYIENLVGAPGLTATLAITAIAFLTYLSAETIIIIRKLLNPTRFIDKVKFKVTNNDPNEKVESYEEQMNVGGDPEVFDDPAEQVVEFKDDGKAVIVDDVYRRDEKDAAKVKTSPKEKAADGTEMEMEVELAKTEETADTKTVAPALDDLEPYDPKRDLENYHYPTLDLLKKYDNDGKPYIDMTEQTANKNRIVEVLRTFGVEISSIKATVGPTITLYEITLAPGVRISKIRSLEDDIALSLSALGIRIIAPIPGTMELPCALGKTITNEVFMFDLAKAPHLLVAGATGQGKSVGLNAIVTSLLYKKHPAEMKIVLVDPKKVEFSIYNPLINHFLAKVPDEDADPIITDVTKVVRTLNSLCKLMDTRYDLLKEVGARNIKEYNKKFIERRIPPRGGHGFMPYIVVIIDEFGDLIMTAGKEIELPIARIAQLARAVGIHMVIATQRPTTTIITGNIKANFPARIAFKVSAGIDSKTILDRTGAQQLIGRGDLLALVGGAEPVRVQCAFVDTPEVERINEFIADQQSYGAPFELPEPDTPDADLGDGGGADVDMQHLDPLFEDAARLIVMNQSGSTSLIQRKFAIGYNRAGRLMDQLEKAGVVGAAMGSKPREVMIQDEMSLNNLLNSLR